MKEPRIAVVHEWLVTRGGSERFLEQLLHVFPNAELFTVVDFYSDEDRALIGGRRAKTTFIQNLPFAAKRFRNYLPLMPLAIEQLDMSGFDIILSSSHAVAKGILVGPDQLHISYVHSPIRYAWDMQHQYLEEAKLAKGLKSWMARHMLHRIRQWDVRTANGVDHFVANSHYIARRIHKAYRRNADVIYPPVDTSSFTLQETKKDFYLTASRLVPYKKVPAIVRAFKEMPDKKLVVIGEGPEMERVKAEAGPNVTILGHQTFASLLTHMQDARAFIFNAEEDFGIVPVEAQACGTPVIAFDRGGACESIRSGEEGHAPTGVFYSSQESAAIADAVRRFESIESTILAKECSLNASRFSAEVFRNTFKSKVETAFAEFNGNR